jgi:hypothetical protein
MVANLLVNEFPLDPSKHLKFVISSVDSMERRDGTIRIRHQAGFCAAGRPFSRTVPTRDELSGWLEAMNSFGGSMENLERSNGSLKPVSKYDVGHVQEVVRQAHDELRQLMQQRAEIMKRIGTVKQTISGLANLFGDDVLNDELMELVDRKSNGRQPGFTKACRMILMESGRAMNSRDICDYFQQKMPGLLARHKDPMASVTTVLNRLVEYGEAEAVVANGRRAWRWVADVPEPPAPRSEPSLIA